MYRRILLAYDGSREGRSALREGALIALKFKAEVFLLSVVAETPGVQLGEAAHAGAVAHTQDTYKSLFDEAMNKLAAVGLKGQGRLAVGEPPKEIAAYAQEVKADLVVVGHRRRGLLERWWSGSAGVYLSDHLSCSLLIGRCNVSDEDFLEQMATAAKA